jgi:Tfp pilus assembly protein PilX
MNPKTLPSHAIHCRHASTQRGVVLFIALIALVALSLAGIALYRSVDSSNAVAGNLAFRQSVLQAADHGVEAAFKAIQSLGDKSKTNTNVPNQYRATRLDALINGETRTVDWVKDIDWASVKCRDYNNTELTTCPADYQVKYFIDRLCSCNGNLSATNHSGVCTYTVNPLSAPESYCSVDKGTGKTGSKGAFSASFSSVSAIYYRVTVQVTGPRNTTSYVQTIFSIGY